MAKQQSNVRTRERVFTATPRHYKVIFHNDDVTTMDFVVRVLMTVFLKSHDDAYALMMEVHTNGKAPVGVYTYDIAISLAQKATAEARRHGFPLRITIEEE